MSREYIDDPKQDVAWSLRSIRDDVDRIADVLEDYLDLTLAGQQATRSLQSLDPSVAEALRPLTEAMEAIATRVGERRSER